MYPFFMVLLLTVLGAELAASFCSINVDTPLESKTPIVLFPGGSIMYPQSTNGDITFNNNDQVQFLCSGSGNTLQICAQQLVTGTCINNRFRLSCSSVGPYSWDKLKCRQSPQPETEVDAVRCNQNAKKIHIGFKPTPGSFIRKIQVCYDENAHKTFWTRHELLHSTYSCRKGGTSFRKQEFNGDPLNVYNKNSGTYQKGHLTPKCDFSTGVEKRMTYYYINAAPQVKEVNDGNWKDLEIEIRRVNTIAGRVFYIYTGTEGLSTTISDSKITLPVPQFFWKVVIDSRNGNGVAFVGVNDISKHVASPCPSKCASLRWLRANFLAALTVQRKGVYCCDVGDLVGFEVPAFSEHTGGFLDVIR